LGDDTWLVSSVDGCHAARLQTATEHRRNNRFHVGAMERLAAELFAGK